MFAGHSRSQPTISDYGPLGPMPLAALGGGVVWERASIVPATRWDATLAAYFIARTTKTTLMLMSSEKRKVTVWLGVVVNLRL